MRLRKWIIMGACLLGACALANVGCGARGTAPVEDRSQGGAEGALGLEFDYEVNPADFSLTLYVDGQSLPAAGASDERRTEQVKTEEELSQVAGGGATRRSPGKLIMPVKSGEKK